MKKIFFFVIIMVMAVMIGNFTAMAVNICPFCEKMHDDDYAKYCPQCGEQLLEDEELSELQETENSIAEGDSYAEAAVVLLAVVAGGIFGFFLILRGKIT